MLYNMCQWQWRVCDVHAGGARAFMCWNPRGNTVELGEAMRRVPEAVRRVVGVPVVVRGVLEMVDGTRDMCCRYWRLWRDVCTVGGRCYTMLLVVALAEDMRRTWDVRAGGCGGRVPYCGGCE